MNNEPLKYKKIRIRNFILAIIIDLVGISSYIIPVVGESVDLVWGPISGVLIFFLFHKRTKMAIFGFVEEVIPLPFTDFIPTALIAWCLDYVKDNNKTLSEFFKKEVERNKLLRNGPENE